MAASDYDTALTGLYAAFDAPRPQHIIGCPCCVDTRNVDVLLSKQLGLLTGGDLSRYASGVFLTVGGQIDYRYLLPRILEVAANDTAWCPSAEITVGALGRAEWTYWSEAERKAVTAFLSAWFDRWAASASADDDGFGYGCEIEPLLCGMARAGMDLEPYLRRLLDPGNALALSQLHEMHGEAARKSAPAEFFWEDAPAGWDLLMNFLTRSAVEERLRAMVI